MVNFPAQALKVTAALTTSKGAAFTAAIIIKGLDIAKSGNNQALQLAYIKLLKGSVGLTKAVATHMLPKYLTTIRRLIQTQIANVRSAW